MIQTLKLSGKLISQVSRANETPLRTIERLIRSEKRRIAGRNFRPKGELERVHLSQKAADCIDALRHSYRINTGLWPEQT